MITGLHVHGGLHRGLLVLFSVKGEFKKLFFVFHDLKVLHEP